MHVYTAAEELPKSPTVAEEQARVAQAHIDAEGNNFALRIHGARTRASWSLWEDPAIDGERHGAGVRSPNAGKDASAWLQVDLAAEAMVDRVVGCGVTGDSTFRVQVEVDGEWIQVGDRPKPTPSDVEELVFSLEPRQTKRVRLLDVRTGEEMTRVLELEQARTDID